MLRHQLSFTFTQAESALCQAGLVLTAMLKDGHWTHLVFTTSLKGHYRVVIDVLGLLSDRLSMVLHRVNIED